MVSLSKELAKNQFFLIGDSAYGIRSFLLTPYDNAKHKSQEDTFNYFLSRARIWVECAFGEIDMRWGIFWKKLAFDLNHSVTIIDAALRLHNFLVDYRDQQNIKKNYILNNIQEFNTFERECTEFSKLYPEALVGVFGDNTNDEI